MEAPWLPTVLNMLADVPQHCPNIKDLIMNVLVGQLFNGLPYLHFTQCVVETGVLFLSLSDIGGGNLCIYNKGLPAMLEGMGRLVCSYLSYLKGPPIGDSTTGNIYYHW